MIRFLFLVILSILTAEPVECAPKARARARGTERPPFVQRVARTMARYDHDMISDRPSLPAPQQLAQLVHSAPAGPG